MAKKGALKPISPRELSIFSRQMALIVGSDITIQQGVAMLLEQADDSRLQVALSSVLVHMDEGMPFYEAFSEQSGAFPEYLMSMVEVGEQSGTLDIVFDQMADYYEKEYRVQRKVSAALTYPAILTALMLGVIVLLIARILPMFEGILTSMGGTLPAMTQALMGFASLVSKNGLFILGAIALLVVIYIVYRGSKGGRMAHARNQLRSPFTGSIRQRVLTARFARSVGILLRSGVPILSAMSAMDTLLGNPYAAGLLRDARMKVQEGEDFTGSLKQTKLFSPLFLRLVHVGQSTGFMDEMMLKAASIYDDEVDDALERLTTSIEPILIIVLSVVVGIILLSVMLPMITIMGNIG